MSQQASRRVRELAREQAGVVSRQQALKAGMSVGEIYAKVKSGRWSAEHRGVYRTFTGPTERDARLWAAVLYVGAGARLSHGTAAELNGLTDRLDPTIQVKNPARPSNRRPKGRNSAYIAHERPAVASSARASALHASRGDGH